MEFEEQSHIGISC